MYEPSSGRRCDLKRVGIALFLVERLALLLVVSVGLVAMRRRTGRQ